MATIRSGTKVSEVTGKVKCYSVESMMNGCKQGSLVLYRMTSDLFYIHTIVPGHRNPPKLQISKKSVATLCCQETCFSATIPSGLTVHVKNADKTCLESFVEALKDAQKQISNDTVENLTASSDPLQQYESPVRDGYFQSKLPVTESHLHKTPTKDVPVLRKTPSKSGPWLRKPPAKDNYLLGSSPARRNSKENIENQPSNANNSSPQLRQTSATRPQSKPRRRKVSLARSSDFFPSLPTSESFSSDNKKPLCDSTHSTENLSNTSGSLQSNSVTRFYGTKCQTRPSYGLWGNRPRPPQILSPPTPKQTVTKTYSSLSSSVNYRKTQSRLFVDSISDSQEIVQLKGFSNLGNTCYMNAILQSLLGLATFAHDLSNRTLVNQVHPLCLYKCMYQLLCCKRNNSSFETQRLHLKKLKSTISAAATRFSGYLQHDAHEFLCQVLEQIKDDVENCDPSTTPSKRSSTVQCTESMSPISRNFDCHIIHVINCKECGEQTTKEEIFRDFSLDIPNLCSSSSPPVGAIKIEELIERFFKDEVVEYDCKECGCKEATVSHRVTRLPRILILHLKRYGFNRGTDEQAKRKDNISITKSIDIGKLCSPKTVTPLKFELPKPVKASPVKSQRRNKRPCEKLDNAGDLKSSPLARRKLIKATNRRHNQSPAKRTTDRESANDFIVLSDGDESTPSPTKRSRDSPSSSRSGSPVVSAKKSRLINDSNGTIYGRNVSELSEEDQLKWALKESKRDAADTKKRKAQSTKPGDVDLSDWISIDDIGNFTKLLNDKDSLSAAVEQFSDSEPKPLDLRGGSCHKDSVKTGDTVETKASPAGKSRVFSRSQKGTNLEHETKERFVQLNTLDAISDNEDESNTKVSMEFDNDEIAQAIARSLEVQEHASEADEELKKALEMSLQDYEKSHGCVPVEEYDSGFASPGTNKERMQEIEESRCQLSHEYRLVSIVSHIGHTSASGHYISDVYDCKTKQWMSYNDSTVEKVTEHEVRYSRCNTGYIFFYQDKQSVESAEQSAALKDRVGNT